ncbi:hypothetical protein ACOTI9_00965 [Achromobacter mucicolens]|uniref:hypothetical protein n=1 Tax=Achromobacter mucicolens TaxID=1389922 RepID=UPI003B9961E7
MNARETGIRIATKSAAAGIFARKHPGRRMNGGATVDVGLRNCHWVPVYRRARASWRGPAQHRRAGANKAECLPLLRSGGKRLSKIRSEQNLEKLAPAMPTPVAKMAAERAGTTGTKRYPRKY